MRIILIGFFLLLQFIITESSSAQSVVNIVVSGKPLSVNGQTKVPESLFGVHLGNFIGYNSDTVFKWGIVSARSIETIPAGAAWMPSNGLKTLVQCWYDRFVPATILTNSNWKSILQNLGNTYGKTANPSNSPLMLEFWNEPYLNWAYKPGVNTDIQFYNQSGISENAPVFRNGSIVAEPYLIWRTDMWYDSPKWASNRQGVYNAISTEWNKVISAGCFYPCQNALVIDSTYRKTTSSEFTPRVRLRPVDTTQKSYYSSKQMEHYYNQMYQIVADTIKKLNPAVQMIAGWGMESHKDNWLPWHTLIKPTFDKNIHLIDGYHEHHYGTDTRIIAADYETITAYTDKKYLKRLKFYNTETGGFLDPQRPDGVSSSPGTVTAAQKALNAFSYNIRDIVYMIDKCPDKAATRAVHEPQNTNGGVEKAFKLSKTFRGNMIYDESSDEEVYTITSLNDSLMTTICFNGNMSSRILNFEIKATQGMIFNGGYVLSVDTLPGMIILQWKNLTAVGARFNFIDTIDPYTAKSYVLRLTGVLSAIDTIYVKQFYADTILVEIPAASSSDFKISIPQQALDNAQAARIKYVLMNYKSGGSFSLNGKNYSIVNYSGGNPEKSLGGISYQTIDLANLTTNNTLAVYSGDTAIKVWMASIELTNSKLYDSLTDNQKIKKPDIGFTMQPNPATKNLHIKTVLNDKASISIIALDGKSVLEQSIHGNSDLNISGIGNGLYIVVCKQGTELYREKLIIKN